MTDFSERFAHLSPTKRALLALQLQERRGGAPPAGVEPIAIVGLGCRFPGGANTPELFWQLLRDGVDAISEVPPDRWDVEALYDPNPDAPGKIATRWGGFLDDVASFDPHFFGISPREAEYMDPQQRLVLEVAWEALEDAGCAPLGLAGSQTGVFIGVSTWDFVQQQVKGGDPCDITAYSGTGAALSVVAGRLSYVLGLQGPSLALDTACSSSLVAVHVACQSLRQGECSMALAGGVNVLLLPEAMINFSRAHMMAADGRCKTFDAAADGYVRSEGCGVLVLRRLSDAVASGDRVLAVIRGSAVNQDGRSGGLTVPNGRAQQQLLRQALAAAGVQPSEVGYVEAHGTGTALGDPIEVGALAAVFGSGRAVDHPLLVGSVKTNVGHLEAAAGMAGLMKVVLALQHGEIPPHLHLRQVNPLLPIGDAPIQIPTVLSPWGAGGGRRVAGVSSFGFSGTNAHVVVEEAPPPAVVDASVAERGWHLLGLSARTDSALKQLVKRYQRALAMRSDAELADCCFTAGVGRSHFAHRVAFVADGQARLREQLLQFALGRSQELVVQVQGVPTPGGRVAWLFTGQGSQYVGMGRALYACHVGFRATLDRCDVVLRPYLGESLLSVLFPADESVGLLHETAYTQPALFALEYALAQLWRAWGVEPAVVLGHSVGEYVAACVAGAFSLEDGLRLIAERARLMQALPLDGAMASVFADYDRVATMIRPYAGTVAVAAINGVKSVVVSGLRDHVQLILQQLALEGVTGRVLSVSHAFHSPLMEPMLAAFAQVAQQVVFQPLQVPLISNVTGEVLRPGVVLDAAYWCRHVREPVQFLASLRALEGMQADVGVEIGPSATLINLAQDCALVQPRCWVASLRKGQDDWQTLLGGAGVLYVQGFDLDWGRFEQGGQRRRVVLPTYPFEREVCWPRLSAGGAGVSPTGRVVVGVLRLGHPLIGARVLSPLEVVQFETQVSTRRFPFLDDHRVQGVVVLPATAYVELALAAAREVFGSDAYALADVVFAEALFLMGQDARTVQVVVTPQSPGVYGFQVFSLPSGDGGRWVCHVYGRFRQVVGTRLPMRVDVAGLWAGFAQRFSAAEHYDVLWRTGLQYGVSFQGVQQVWREDGAAVGEVRLPQGLVGEAEGYFVHPALLDACLQVLAAALPRDDVDQRGAMTYLPVGMREVRVFRRPGGRVWSSARLTEVLEDERARVVGDVQLFDDDGELVAEVLGFCVQRLDRGASGGGVWDALYDVVWEEQPALVGEVAPVPGAWLIFCDGQGVGQAIGRLIEARGGRCTLVGMGDGVVSRDEVVRLMGDLAGAAFQGVLYVWGLDASPVVETTADSLEVDVGRAAVGLLHVTQALAMLAGPVVPRLWVVTRRAQWVGVDRAVSVAQSVLWGLGRSFVLEVPDVWGGLIDVDGVSEGELVAVCEELWRAGDEDQVVFRDGLRFVPRLRAVERGAEVVEPVMLRADGSYMVTGGFGGLGLQVAGWLVEQGARRVVLVGRGGLPDRADWGREHPVGVAQQIAAVQELEGRGATVVCARCDVADAQAMAGLFAELGRMLPPLRGVIHAAGVVEPWAFEELDAERLLRVLRPKVQGGWVVHALTQGLDLDFFVLFSSISAVWGSRSLAHYGAANLALDAIAAVRRGAGLPALSVNWGPWQGAGMAEVGLLAGLRRLGVTAIAADEGFAALGVCLGGGVVQRVVVKADWDVFRSVFEARRRSPLFAYVHSPVVVVDSVVGAVFDERLRVLAAPAGERQGVLVDFLRQQIGEVLRIDPGRLDQATPLSAVGLDSLMAVELKNRIERLLGVTVPMVSVLQGPTVSQLAAELLGQVEEVDSSVPGLTAAVQEQGESPLSYGQRALWFLHQVAPESPAYNIFGATLIHSQLDLEAFRETFRRLIVRHPSLRTTFSAPQGVPVQYVHAAMALPFAVHDASAWAESEVQAFLVAEAHRPFDLEQGPLVRVTLLRRVEGTHVFLLVIHHTVADFWSLVILIQELGVLYQAIRGGGDAEVLPTLPLRYTDYVRWQEALLSGTMGERLWSYWRQKLGGELPVLNLATDRPRPPVQTFRGASQTIALESDLTLQLRALGEAYGATLYMVLLAAFQVLLHRYTGQDDVIVGSPMAGRVRADLAGVMGYFVSPVALRAGFAGDPPFEVLLRQVRQTVLEALEHQEYPIALLVERLRPARDASRSPLFQAMFILQKAQLLNDQGLTPFVLRETGMTMDLGGLLIESLALEQRIAQFDVTLVMAEAEGRLLGSLEYNVDLFDDATIGRMLANFRVLLGAIVAEPARSVSALSLLADAERALVVRGWNATRVEYPTEALVSSLVGCQVERRPDAVAVCCAGRVLTFAALDGRANQVAHVLRGMGVGPEVLVGVCVERSLEMVVGVLGILKAGGAYVPLDPGYPGERLAYMIADAGLGIVLADRASAAVLPPHGARVVELDAVQDVIGGQPLSCPVVAQSSRQLAYVIYTSGSLGKPKGVQISHGAVVNFLASMRREPGLTSDDRMVAVTTLSFDIAALEIFLPLVVGGTLIVVPRAVAIDGVQLAEALVRESATVMQATPATWRLLVATGWVGKGDLVVLCGGEALSQDLAAQLVPRGAALWNLYGPTETTIWSTVARVRDAVAPVTIGGPIANTEVYVLDRSMQPVPIGVPGELFIGGEGVARGYLGRPDLTAERFVPNPFAVGCVEAQRAGQEQGGSRLYRTGDLVRYRADGAIEALGRIDAQVKVRGYRIELGEIETILHAHAAVRQVAVAVREDASGTQQLVAYVVPVSSGPLVVEELRGVLRQQVPDYMVPALFVVLEMLPLTPNGKVDRRALPRPEGFLRERGADVAEPQTELERVILGVWRSVLQVEQIGIHDNFFDLGGHSLLAAQVHRLLRDAVKRDLSVVDLFRHPTISALARFLGQAQSSAPAIQQVQQRVQSQREAIQQQRQRFRERKKANDEF